jgi:glycosyl transferase family 87
MSAVTDRSMRRALEHGLLGVLPVALTVWLAASWLAGHAVAVDFDHAYWSAGQRVLHGASPYLWSQAQIAASWAFVYPAVAAILFAPAALLPRGVDDLLATAVCWACLFGALRAVDVRDWRLYGLCLLLSPVVAAWHTANLSLPLAFGLALVWRWRDRPVRAGLLAALLISCKTLVWPLGLWLLATRRYRAGAIAMAGGLVVNLLAWGAIGVREVGRFLHLSSVVTSAEFRQGYGVLALASHLGVGRGPAGAAMVLLAVAAAAGCVIAGRRGRERDALTLAVAVMLLASAVVWTHYFVLALVPLALAYPRLSGAWVALLALWLCPAHGATGWEVIVAWVVVGGVLAAAVSPRRAAVAASALRSGPARALRRRMPEVGRAH